MLKQITPLILIVAVSACSSSVERRQANGAEKYADAKIQPGLIIPEGLLTPKYSSEYTIPALGPKADPDLVGPVLDIRPPLQVLATAEGTRVEEGDDNIKVVVESIGSDLALKKELFDDVKAFLAKKSIKIRQQDFAKGTIETDWITAKEVVASHLWDDDDVFELRQRYLFEINVSPQGKTGELQISLVEHKENYVGSAEEQAEEKLLTDEDKRRYTIDMLNSAISYIGSQRTETLKHKRLQEGKGIKLTVVDDNGSLHWVANAPFQRTWERLRLTLPEMGFSITDADLNSGIYYVEAKEESGFWSSLWSDDDETIPTGEYRFSLKELKSDRKKTAIYLTGDKDQAVEQGVAQQLSTRLIEQMQEQRKAKVR